MTDAHDQLRDRLREAVQVLAEAQDAAADLGDMILTLRLRATVKCVYACQERAAELGMVVPDDQRVT